MSADLPLFTRVAIVGASGSMGQLFMARLAAAGVDTLAVDRPYSEQTLSAIGTANLVIVSVPVTAMEKVLGTIAPHMAPTATLSDVCSVKAVPMKLMAEAHAGPVVGTHPLFGPVIPEGFEPRVAVTPHADADPAPVSALMAALGFSPFTATADEHDRAMAFVQGLNFITSVAHLSAIRQVDNVEQYVTPSFARRLEAARKMLTQDAELFEAISEANPYLQETVRQFTGFLNIAAGGDLDLLCERARWWWREDT